MVSPVALTLRPAVTSDIALLRAWDHHAHVIASTTDDPAALEAHEGVTWEDEIAMQSEVYQYFIGECDGRAIGAMLIIDPHREPTRYWGDCSPNQRALDIWIGAEADLGRGYGTAMMRVALERCFADEAVTGVLIDPLASNHRAHVFYQRLGFKPVARRVFNDESDCLVHHLSRADWRLLQFGE